MSSQEETPESVCLTVSMQKVEREHRKRRPSAGQEGALGWKQTGQRLDPGRPAPAARVNGCCLCSPLFLS